MSNLQVAAELLPESGSGKNRVLPARIGTKTKKLPRCRQTRRNKTRKFCKRPQKGPKNAGVTRFFLLPDLGSNFKLLPNLIQVRKHGTIDKMAVRKLEAAVARDTKMRILRAVSKHGPITTSRLHGITGSGTTPSERWGAIEELICDGCIWNESGTLTATQRGKDAAASTWARRKHPLPESSDLFPEGLER